VAASWRLLQWRAGERKSRQPERYDIEPHAEFKKNSKRKTGMAMR
jgi:hypothetical protein